MVHPDSPGPRARSAAWRSWIVESPSLFLARLRLGHEQAEWQEWADCDVLVIHKIFLAQRKAVHDRLRLGDIAGIQQEDGSPTIAARIPFTNFPTEIELHGLTDFSRHDGHYLFACDARLHGKDRDHASGCRRGGLSLSLSG